MHRVTQRRRPQVRKKTESRRCIRVVMAGAFMKRWARLPPRYDLRLGIKPAAAGSRDARQPTAADDGGAFKPATAGYGQGLAGAGFRWRRSRRFWGSAQGRPGGDPLTRPLRNSDGRHAPSYLRVCAGPCWDPRRWHSWRCVRSVHQRGRRRRDGDSRRARQHAIGRADWRGQ
jgi:hypothetical protein